MNTGEKQHSPFGHMAYDFDDVLDALHMAAIMPSIDAIVLRVNSPGGTPEAAETLRRAVTKALEKKPVVASFSNIAASGGYWVSVNGMKIFAEPMSITGSIGVFGAKISMPGLLQKIGIQFDRVQKGKNAAMWSPAQAFTAEQKKKVQKSMQYVYDAFIQRVAQGRGLRKKEVESLAQGKVYTGRQAVKSGLVDSLGGMNAAAEYALTLAGCEAEDGMALLSFPPPRNPLEKIISLFKGRFDASAVQAWFARIINSAGQNQTGSGVYAATLGLQGSF
jgi:protease-4